MIVVEAATAADTRRLGRALAALVHRGDIILLTGPLGAGKTVLAAGIAEGLGVAESLPSPSFVLVRTYRDGFMPLVHADVYRIGSSGEFEDLDLVDLARAVLLRIEGCDAVAGLLPDTYLTVELMGTGDGSRTIRFTPRGSWLARPLEGLVEVAAMGRAS